MPATAQKPVVQKTAGECPFTAIPRTSGIPKPTPTAPAQKTTAQTPEMNLKVV